MSRIPYVPADLGEPKEIVNAIRQRRGGGLLNLDRILLHCPEQAAGWNVFLGAVRRGGTLSPRLREIAICAVAALNKADYEFVHHGPELIKAGGTQAEVDALEDVEKAVSNGEIFGSQERMVLQLVIELTRDVVVSADTLSRTRAELGGDAALVELIIVISAYNMVSRVIVASGIRPEGE